MKFSIVIPTVKQVTMLFECIESFKKHHGDEHEIIIVEDGSDLATQALVKQRGEAAGCKVILSEKNCGFSTTVNKGIRAASGDVVIAVNNDILFTRPILSHIQSDMEKDPKIGIIGALLFYPNGLIQHGGVFRQGRLFGHRGYKKKYDDASDVQTEKYLISVTGALFAMRKKFLDDAGLFKEDFFLASEDTELCLRAWLKGWRVLYEPKVQAIHKEGETRGNTHESKAIKGREWYKKELQTSSLFIAMLQGMEQRGDIVKIEREVNVANLNKPVFLSDRDVRKEEMKPAFISKVVEKPKLSSKEDGKIIGIAREGAFGDALMSTPIIREIRRRHPKSRIWVATAVPDAFSGNVNVDRVIRSKAELSQFTDALFDLDLVYERDPKKNIVDAYSDYVFGEQLSDRSLDLYSDDNDLSSLFSKIAGTVMFERDKIITIHMGVGWVNRTWPRDSWMKVIRALATRGYKICVVGRGGDFKADLIAGVVNLNDKLSIREVRELIKKSSVFCGPDSGILHVAQTTSTPIVSLFTVANPKYRMVRSEMVTNLIPKSECRFCLHELNPPVTFVSCKFAHNNCLKEITPNEVIQSIGQMMVGR